MYLWCQTSLGFSCLMSNDHWQNLYFWVKWSLMIFIRPLSLNMMTAVRTLNLMTTHIPSCTKKGRGLWDWLQKTDEWKPRGKSSVRWYESKVLNIHQFYHHWFSHAASSPAVTLPIKVRLLSGCIFQPCVFAVTLERSVLSWGKRENYFKFDIKSSLACCRKMTNVNDDDFTDFI